MDRTTRPRIDDKGVSARLDLLPRDVFASVASNLTGFDLLSLSHFPRDLALAWSSSSFSFDLWFALLPGAGSPPNKLGGILFGGQSTSWENVHRWAYYRQQFVLVNDRGELACSMLTHRPVVKSDLEVERWYHVALTFDRLDPEDHHGTQRVYVDGMLVHTHQGRLHHEWYQLAHIQIGSGCVTGGAPAGPDRQFIGWYCFNGDVDEFRTWDGVLSAKQVQRLARGATVSTDKLQCVWSMKDEKLHQQGPVKRVRCSRPLERACTVAGDCS